MKVYIVIRPITKDEDYPEIIGVYKDKHKAEKIAASGNTWRNVAEYEIE